MQCGPGLHYSANLWIQTYNTEPVPLKYEKNSQQNIRGYTDIFSSADCGFNDKNEVALAEMEVG